VTVAQTDVYYDMYDRDIYASPHKVYRRLRDEAPLYYNDKYDFYAVSRFDDVMRVLNNRDVFISGKGGVYNVLKAGIGMPPGLFIFSDPPAHTLHRSLVSRLFTPRAVSGLEPQIRELCVELVDALVGAERFDFMRDFAVRLPVQVIGMLIGVPKADQPSMLETIQRNLHAKTADQEADPLEGILEVSRWFGDYLDWREKHPAADVMGQLLNLEFQDETGTKRKLRRDELVTYLVLITSAGSDTTATALGWAGKLLGEHPEQRRALLKDPSLIPNAVEEVLRCEPPTYHFCRWVTQDVEFHDQTVPAESIMVVLPPAANRDDRKFDDPETFNVHRSPGQILTFGYGTHFCLGASLARMELRVALQTLLPRIPDWSVDIASASMTTGIDTRGWETLPVFTQS